MSNSTNNSNMSTLPSYSKTAEAFRERLSQCMKESGLKKINLARELNKTYQTSYTHTDVANWLKTGEKAKLSEKHKHETHSFPKLTTFLYLSDYFDVDIGYLLGETDYDTFDLGKASQYLSLSKKAVSRIRLATAMNTHNVDDDLVQLRNHGSSLDCFICSEQFIYFSDYLAEAYSASPRSKPIKERFSCREEADKFIKQKNDNLAYIKYEVYSTLVRLMDECFPDYCIKDIENLHDQEWY